jgi:hypothetical protein
MPAQTLETGRNRRESSKIIDASGKFRIELPQGKTKFVKELTQKLIERFPSASVLTFHPQSVDKDDTYKPARLTREGGIQDIKQSLIVIGDQVCRIATSDYSIWIQDVGIPYVDGSELKYCPTERNGILGLRFTEWTSVGGSGHKPSITVSIEARTERSGDLITGFLSAINEIKDSHHLETTRLRPYEQH